MELTPSPYPTSKQLRQSAVGTTFVYRRYLIFGPEPLWFVCTKLEEDRWVRAQSPRSIEAALAVVGGSSGQMHEAVLDAATRRSWRAC